MSYNYIPIRMSKSYIIKGLDHKCNDWNDRLTSHQEVRWPPLSPCPVGSDHSMANREPRRIEGEGPWWGGTGDCWAVAGGEQLAMSIQCIAGVTASLGGCGECVGQQRGASQSFTEQLWRALWRAASQGGSGKCCRVGGGEEVSLGITGRQTWPWWPWSQARTKDCTCAQFCVPGL